MQALRSGVGEAPVSRRACPLAAMSFSRALVENHGKIAAVVFPLSIMGGFAYTMATGSSPMPVREEKAAEGEGPDSAWTVSVHWEPKVKCHHAISAAVSLQHPLEALASLLTPVPTCFLRRQRPAAEHVHPELQAGWHRLQVVGAAHTWRCCQLGEQGAGMLCSPPVGAQPHVPQSEGRAVTAL